MSSVHGRVSSKGMSYIIAAFLVLISFHALITVWLASLFGHYTELRLWKEMLLLALAVPVIWVALRNPDIFKQFIKNRLMLLIVAFIGLQIVAGIIAYLAGSVSLKALGYGWIVNLRFLLFFLLCAFVANRTDWLRMNWRTILLLPAIVVIVFGLLQFFALPHDFMSHLGYGDNTIAVQSLVDNDPDYLRVQSTQRGANPLGAYLVIILTALTVLVATRNHLRAWRVLMIVAGAACLLLTFSRSAWLGLAFAAVAAIFLCTKTRRQRRITITVILSVILLFGASLLVLNKNDSYQNVVFHTSDESGSKESSNQAHVSAKTEGLKEVIAEPLGRGPGTAGPASIYNSGHESRIAENYFLQIGQEVGWLGLILFVLILCALARGWLRERNATLNRVMLASLVGLVVINMLWHGFTDDTVAYIWWGLTGIAYGSQIARQQERAVRASKGLSAKASPKKA